MVVARYRMICLGLDFKFDYVCKTLTMTITYELNKIGLSYYMREKGRDLTQSCDKNHVHM